MSDGVVLSVVAFCLELLVSRRLSGSQLLGLALKSEGIGNVFGLAGDHVLPALDAISDMGFKVVDTRHEQAAVHMADAWSRISGAPGVAMYTTPGFANAIPGLASALHSEGPVLSISGSAPLADLGRGATQELDQVGMATPVTKGSWIVTDPRRIPQMVSHALRVAYSGRRGPVHITIPIDVQEMVVEEGDVVFYRKGQSEEVGTQVTPSLIKDIISLLRTASRPLIIAGTAAAYSNSGEALAEFIETTRLPVMTEGDGRGLVSDSHPQCRGFYDAGLNAAARMIRQADLVLLLGRRQDFVMGYAMPPIVSANAKVVQIDPSSVEIGRNRDVAVGIVGSVDAVLRYLTEEARNHIWSELDWSRELERERDTQLRSLAELETTDVPMHPMQIYKAIKPLLRPDDHLVFDAGDFCHFGRAFLPAQRPRSWWYFPTLGMLGMAVPIGIAAKLADPSRRVIVFSGDGGFGFNGMEIDTAVRHDLPMVVVLGNDAAWGIDRQIQLAVYGKSVATDLYQTRYDIVVDGLGGFGQLVEKPEELAPAFSRAVASRRPALLNVPIQRTVSPRGESAIARWKAGRH